MASVMFSEIRDIDPAGRVVIPSGVRKYLAMKPGDKVQVYVHKGTIIVRKLQDVCTFCNSIIESEDDAILFDNKVICKSCHSELKMISA